MSERLVIELPLPPRELSPNARVHWARKAKRIKWYRGRAWAEALAAQGRRVRGWNRATAQLTFYRKTRGRVDSDNLLASMKSAFDGIADAGVIQDDCGLTHLPVKIDKDATNPRVVVELTAEGQ